MSGGRSTIGYLLLGTLILAVALNGAGALSDRALDHVFLGSVGWMAWRLAERPLGGARAGLAALTLVGGLALLHAAVPGLRYMPYLLIVPVNLAMAVVFARGLMPGRRPVLLALIEFIGMAPTDDAAFRRFVARQCALWSVMALGTALLAFGALVHAPMRQDLAGALRILIAVQIAWFALSHYYAMLRYRRPETWWTTLKVMARPEVWSRLRTE